MQRFLMCMKLLERKIKNIRSTLERIVSDNSVEPIAAYFTAMNYWCDLTTLVSASLGSIEQMAQPVGWNRLLRKLRDRKYSTPAAKAFTIIYYSDAFFRGRRYWIRAFLCSLPLRADSPVFTLYITVPRQSWLNKTRVETFSMQQFLQAQVCI